MPIGTCLKDRYRIIKRIGDGSNGVVFLTEDTKSRNEKKAVKKVYIEKFKYEDIFNFIVPEIAQLISLKHDNLIRYYEHFAKHEFLYLIIEYCEGGNLETFLENNELNRIQLFEWFSQLVGAVKYLHNKDTPYLHKNLKSSSILIKNNQLKIGNFSIYKTLTHQPVKLKTSTHTSAYTAPEIIDNEEYTVKSDIWSLGIILFELCANKFPFNCLDETKNKPTPILLNEFEDMNPLLTGMLQKNHKKRFDINQVENEFNGILRGRKDIIPITSKNIFEACEENKIEDVVYFIRDVNSKNEKNFKKTPLIIATEKGHINLVKLLVDNNSLINARDAYGNTALILASYNGYFEIIEYLISYNAEVNCKDKDGRNALMFASWNGYEKIVKFLLNHRADANAKDNSGNTALMYACQEGYIEIIKMLISAKAEINCKDKDGWSPLMFSSYNGHEEIVKLLLSIGVEINCQTNGGETPLMKASREGHFLIVELLKNHNADVNTKSKEGNSAFMLALIKGHRAIIELLK